MPPMLPSDRTNRRRLASDLDGPITRRAALSVGISDRELQGPRFRRLFHGVYVPATVPMTPARWVRAARLVGPKDSFAAYHSAARLLGGVVPDSATTHLGTASARQSRVSGLLLHRYAARPALVDVGGQPCTDAPQTFRDLAGHLELVDLVVLGDSLVRVGWVTPEQLREAVATPGRWAAAAGRAAAYVRAGVDSPPESRLRMLCVLAGLPEPVVGLVVQDRTGRIRRLDLAWQLARVALEYDGRHHIEREAQWVGDLRRREDLERDWRFVVITGPDLFRTPGQTVNRIVETLGERGLVVPRIRPDWRRYFPERGSYLA